MDLYIQVMTANIKYKSLFSWSLIVSYLQMVNDITSYPILD